MRCGLFPTIPCDQYHASVAGEPDLNLLVALRALLEEENVTRAGEKLGMGQSTMSSALARLRAVFEDELLVRIGRDYELTPLARQLLPQVQLTLPLIEQALGQEGRFDPATSARRFSVQASDYAAVELRPLFLRAAAGTGIAVDLRTLSMDVVTDESDLLAHDFMVVVPELSAEAEGIDLYTDEYVVIADAANPAVATGEISVQDFARLPHVWSDFGRGHLTPVERRMRELGFAPTVRVRTSTLLAIPPIVSGTDLLGVVPRRLVERHAAATRTVAVPTPFPPVPLQLRLWWHAAHNYDPAHLWFREFVRDAVAEGIIAA